MTFSPDSYAAIADLSADFAPPTAADLGSLGADELLEMQRSFSEITRRSQACAAVVAARIAELSRHDLGYDGLAQSRGARTPEILVARVAGVSARDARTLVRVGTLMTSGTSPWLDPVAAAAGSGQLSLDAAEAIRAGLGEPNASVDQRVLAQTAVDLLRESGSVSVEQLAIRARDARTALDAAGVADHEELLRSKRYLHLIPQSDGMTRISGLLDPESAAVVVSAYDAATSPRRGGPRFVDPDDVARAERIAADERTTEQVAVDTFVELIRLATHADPGTLLGSRTPAVRVLVTERDLRSGVGIGHIEGQSEAVGIDTVRRHGCAAGYVPIVFNSAGSVLDLGRTQRLFTPRQRLAIAARDGGCRFPDCSRPPSWTEVHHIDEWQRDHGRTDVADGVLLCRHHHLLVHNNGWRVTRTGADYFVVPPRAIDADRRPIQAPSRSAVLRRLLATA